MKLARPYWLVLPAILSLPPYGVSELNIPVPVYIEATSSDQGRFSDLLAVEFSRRSKRITVVLSPDKAQLIVSASSTTTMDRKKGDGETVAAVLVRDRCGRLVWSKNKSRSGGAGGMRSTADAIAMSFKEAIEKPKSRLHRSQPCRSDRPS